MSACWDWHPADTPGSAESQLGANSRPAARDSFSTLELETDGSAHKCEARLITEARNLNARGKLIIPIIDDAHLLPPDALHKLRLLLEDFPKNHNLILLGQPQLNTKKGIRRPLCRALKKSRGVGQRPIRRPRNNHQKHDDHGTQTRSQRGNQQAVLTAISTMPQAHTGLALRQISRKSHDMNLEISSDDNLGFNKYRRVWRKLPGEPLTAGEFAARQNAFRAWVRACRDRRCPLHWPVDFVCKHFREERRRERAEELQSLDAESQQRATEPKTRAQPKRLAWQHWVAPLPPLDDETPSVGSQFWRVRGEDGEWRLTNFDFRLEEK